MNNSNVSNQIQILFNQFKVRNFELVISKTKQLIKHHPEYVILYNLLGVSYQNIGEFNKAKENFIEGLKRDMNNIAMMNNLAMSYKNLLKYDEAENLYLKIIKKNKNYINAYVNLGNLNRDINNFDEAIKLYNEALKLDEKNPIIYYSLSLAHQGLGQFEKSINYAKKTLDLNPNFTQADHVISHSTTYTKENEHYKNLNNKIETLNLNENEKIDVYFALSKAEEDIGNIKKASENLIIGNKLKKKSVNYKISQDTNLFNNIKKIFNKKITKNNKNLNEDNIIFILGMPRSGTSLVEQIITSHSEVFGGGELPILSNIIKNNFILNDNDLTTKTIEILENDSSLERLKNEYLNYLKYFNTNKKFITDKAPLNFRWIGFIKTLFPNAKIIQCTRDPKNNCLSMFKNLFEGGLNFTYDQEDLVNYYKLYLELMDFWKSKYNSEIYEVKYEKLIQNNDDEIKNLIKFCNLNWEEKCLSFHQNKTPIKTMSTAQARKPIYKSSLKSFEKYKDYLTTIETKL